MEENYEKYYYQLKIHPSGTPAYFYLDLELQELLKTFLLPIYLGQKVRLNGELRRLDERDKIQIVCSTERKRPKFNIWIKDSNVHPKHSLSSFCEAELLFNGAERDVTNNIMYIFKLSAEWEEVQKLLKEEKDLRYKKAQAIVNDEQTDSQTDSSIKKITAQILYYIGIVMRGYTDPGI